MSDDEITRQARERWNALAEAGNRWSRAFTDLTAAAARERLGELGLSQDPAGLDVLCLAAGGGQQSALFGLLGAKVTVLELSDQQLERDGRTAAHHGYEVRLEQGDMRDLSRFGVAAFDLVCHGWSLSFVPDPERALDEAMRVLRIGGSYSLELANPISVALDDEGWDGRAYPIRFPFEDGAEIWIDEGEWTWERDGETVRVEGPREWRHSLGRVTGCLAAGGLVLERLWEFPLGDAGAEPGTWEHFCAQAPPWLRLVGRRGPRIR